MQAISYQTFTIIYYCASILDFLTNSYFIVQIYYGKSFKMKYIMSLYLNFSLEYSLKCLNVWYKKTLHQTLGNHLQKNNFCKYAFWHRKHKVLKKKFVDGSKKKRNDPSHDLPVTMCTVPLSTVHAVHTALQN
jgi:hypothetical protein